MTLHSELIFNARKIYFFGALIALLYGLSPLISVWLFDSELQGILPYSIYFLVCWVLVLTVCFPVNRRLLSKIEVNEFRLTIVIILVATIFVVTQVAFYGDFTTAFIVAYTERTGIELSGGMRFVFYPVTTAFISMVLLFTVHLYARRDRINIINVTVVMGSVLIFSALGSRNLLLWGFSGLLALVISRLRYRTILLLIIGIYMFAVFFAFARNNGLIAYLAGSIDHLYDQLSWVYFDPVIHEFGSSYRTFNLIASDANAEQQLTHAPYGQLASFFINQLPSFIKPSDFISFTDYISLMFAERGEGIGSSPMTEAYLSGMASLASLAIFSTLVYWPAFYIRRWPALCLFTYALAVAVCFNVWRIGSAEILKMFLSGAVALFVLAKACGFRVLLFRTIPRNNP
jgi:hypothetical protein